MNIDCPCGLGFDSQTNDHKLLQIFYETFPAWNDRRLYRGSRVYSLKNNSWTSCTNQSENLLRRCRPCFGTSSPIESFNGALYWVDACQSRRCIMRFGFCDEIFREIELPSGCDGEEVRIGSLKEESLALFVGSCSDGDCTVRFWLLNEQVSKEGGISRWSWTRNRNIELVGKGRLVQISFGHNNELLFLGKHLRTHVWGFDSTLYVWDLKQQNPEGFRIDGEASHVFSYSESLLLLS